MDTEVQEMVLPQLGDEEEFLTTETDNLNLDAFEDWDDEVDEDDVDYAEQAKASHEAVLQKTLHDKEEIRQFKKLEQQNFAIFSVVLIGIVMMVTYIAVVWIRKRRRKRDKIDTLEQARQLRSFADYLEQNKTVLSSS